MLCRPKTSYKSLCKACMSPTNIYYHILPNAFLQLPTAFLLFTIRFAHPQCLLPATTASSRDVVWPRSLLSSTLLLNYNPSRATSATSSNVANYPLLLVPIPSISVTSAWQLPAVHVSIFCYCRHLTLAPISINYQWSTLAHPATVFTLLSLWYPLHILCPWTFTSTYPIHTYYVRYDPSLISSAYVLIYGIFANQSLVSSYLSPINFSIGRKRGSLPIHPSILIIYS